jgi:tRNA pseudouridine13 synthase
MQTDDDQSAGHDAAEKLAKKPDIDRDHGARPCREPEATILEFGRSTRSSSGNPFNDLMKVKQSPEDFRVDELTDVIPGNEGDFALYRLEKTGWNTADCLAAIRRLWRIDWRRMEYGGLKDRHAITTQHLTIERGPFENLAQKGWSLTYLGRCLIPFTSDEIRANRFRIVIRNLHPWQIARAEAAAGDLRGVGVPNYFDDQRFGSVNAERQFVAREMVRGRFDEALKLALASEYEFDRAVEKREKKTLLQFWGDWPKCKEALPKGHARSLVDYLVHHPKDFRGACARLRPELRGLYLSVYQSDIWNRVLSRWLQSIVPSADLTGIRLRLGTFAVPKRLASEHRERWQTGTLPLASARWKPEPGDPWTALVESVLSEDGLTLDQMKIKGIDKPFFSKGERPLSLMPQSFELQSVDDERHRGRRKIILSFELGRGSYATMIVKRLTATEPMRA